MDQPWHGRDPHLHCYRYVDDVATSGFAGGPRDHALWMERADIDNPAGAASFLLASRPRQ